MNGLGLLQSYWICYLLWREQCEKDERDIQEDRLQRSWTVVQRIIQNCRDQEGDHDTVWSGLAIRRRPQLPPPPEHRMTAAQIARVPGQELVYEWGERIALFLEDLEGGTRDRLRGLQKLAETSRGERVKGVGGSDRAELDGRFFRLQASRSRSGCGKPSWGATVGATPAAVPSLKETAAGISSLMGSRE